MLNTIDPMCGICGTQLTVSYRGSEPVPAVQCDECGCVLHHIDGNFPVVDRLIKRSSRELADGDWTIPIVLDAIACESLIASLNEKWTMVPKGIPSEITAEDREKWLEEFRSMWSIEERLNKTSRMMVSAPFNEYVQRKRKANPVFRKAFDLYGNSSPLTCIQEKIFEPRNRIVHLGFIDSTESDAAKCHSHAESLVRLLLVMDREKFEAFDKSLRDSLKAH